MALVLKDRVKETTNTAGTGTYTLDGAAVGFQDFSVIGDGNTTYYTVTDGVDWEVGIGTYTSSGTTLSRDLILESSNSGNAVNWGAGLKDVFVTYPAERSAYSEGGALASGLSTFFATPSSANLAAAVTDETGTGSLVFSTSPTFVTPVLGTPTSGNLENCTVDGTNSVGFRNIPQQLQNATYELVLADSGKHIYKDNTTAYTWTIPANSSVAFPIGTAITFVNGGASGNITIAITTDTMRLAGAGTTGSRTLVGYGIATAVKVASTTWIISGTGLT